MKKKYFFFDIDGTLTSAKEHGLIPEDTKHAIQLAKQQGHFLAIATGRSYPMAAEFAHEVGIDHLVCNGGNDLYINHSCYHHAALDRSLCLEVIEECTEKNIPFCVSIDESFNRYTKDAQFKEVIGDFHFWGTLIEDPTMVFEEIENFERIMIAVPEGVEQSLAVFQRHHLPMRYNPHYCILEPDHKGKGMMEMMEILQAPFEDVVVFGDSRNDLTMFQCAPFSIAMGNGIEELKAIASYVTRASDDGGIYHAMQHFKWI